jgi:hypothetical protein
MKKVLLSLGISTLLLIVYAVISAIILVALSPDMQHYNMRVVYYVDIPLRLPKYVYYYFFPPTAQDYSQVMTIKRGALAVAFFAANIFIYTLPVYFALLLISKNRKPKPEHQINTPPPPEVFLNSRDS